MTWPKMIISVIVGMILSCIILNIPAIRAKEYPQDLNTHEANVEHMRACLDSAEELCEESFGSVMSMYEERLAIAFELYRSGR